MKTLLLHLLAFCAILAPMHTAEARAPKPPAVFGGFQVGTTFTFPVTNRISQSQIPGGEPQPVIPPKGIPSFAVGEQVTFTIGKKGELLAPKGVNIPFVSESTTANIYTGKPSRKAPTPPSGIVHKNATTGAVTGVSLQYVQVKIARRIPTTTVVWYTIGSVN